MIFVTTGSMAPFDRLVKSVDDWSMQRQRHELLVQLGNGNYLPKCGRWVRMMPPADFNQSVKECDLVVAHLGMGSIITAMQACKPVLLLPRSQALGECNSDHQLDGVGWLNGRPGLWIADNEQSLHGLLDQFEAGHLLVAGEGVTPQASAELLANVTQFIRGAVC